MSFNSCPFCNGEARLSIVKDGNGDTFYTILCKNCGCKTDGWRSMQKAEEMWNRRVAPTMMQLEIERIVSELKKIPTRSIAVIKAIKIVQEVTKEHRKLNRCDTCTHYVVDEVPPICYFCCKGMEDNYVEKE